MVHAIREVKIIKNGSKQPSSLVFFPKKKKDLKFMHCLVYLFFAKFDCVRRKEKVTKKFKLLSSHGEGRKIKNLLDLLNRDFVY